MSHNHVGNQLPITSTAEDRAIEAHPSSWATRLAGGVRSLSDLSSKFLRRQSELNAQISFSLTSQFSKLLTTPIGVSKFRKEQPLSVTGYLQHQLISNHLCRSLVLFCFFRIQFCEFESQKQVSDLFFYL
jgi:hypothetical protein